jgi:hypothetical protein
MIMVKLDLSFDDLYLWYSGKFELNGFRQENGYKEGTYRKKWFDGREDNQHLAEILQDAKENQDQFTTEDDLGEYIAVNLHQRYTRTV